MRQGHCQSPVERSWRWGLGLWPQRWREMCMKAEPEGLGEEEKEKVKRKVPKCIFQADCTAGSPLPFLLGCTFPYSEKSQIFF